MSKEDSGTPGDSSKPEVIDLPLTLTENLASSSSSLRCPNPPSQTHPTVSMPLIDGHNQLHKPYSIAGDVMSCAQLKPHVRAKERLVPLTIVNIVCRMLVFFFARTRSKLWLSPVQGQNVDLSSMMVANNGREWYIWVQFVYLFEN